MNYFGITILITKYTYYIYIYNNYLEIQRMINNYNDYRYIYIYMNYLEILSMINNYNDYIYIYIYNYICIYIYIYT